MKVTIQLDPQVYDHIRTLVHDELTEQENRRKFKQLAMKIRTQLVQLSRPDKSEASLEINLNPVLHD